MNHSSGPRHRPPSFPALVGTKAPLCVLVHDAVNGADLGATALGQNESGAALPPSNCLNVDTSLAGTRSTPAGRRAAGPSAPGCHITIHCAMVHIATLLAFQTATRRPTAHSMSYHWAGSIPPPVATSSRAFRPCLPITRDTIHTTRLKVAVFALKEFG